MLVHIIMHKPHLLPGETSIYPQTRKSSLETSQKVICFKKIKMYWFIFAWIIVRILLDFFFGNNTRNQIGWPCKRINDKWSSNFWYVKQFIDGGSISSHQHNVDSYSGEKRKEAMWIHHFVILQLFHPKYQKEQKIHFVHDNHSLFICHFNHHEDQEHTNLIENTPRFEYLWLDQRI